MARLSLRVKNTHRNKSVAIHPFPNLLNLCCNSLRHPVWARIDSNSLQDDIRFDENETQAVFVFSGVEIQFLKYTDSHFCSLSSLSPSITMPSTRTLQKYAIAVSIFSLFYNTGEGVVSILFGAENSSRALVFYGIQSAVEVISDLLVTWRFLSVNEPGNDIENTSTTSPQIIR